MKYILPLILCTGCCDPSCYCPSTVSTSVCHSWQKERACCYDEDPNGILGDLETKEKNTQVCVKAEWKLR